MPIVEHLEQSAWWVYSGKMPGTGRAWLQGERREVPQATADYLTRTFPEGFAVVSVTAPAAPSEPEVNRAMKPPPKRKAAPRKAATKKPATKKAATKKPAKAKK